jgi:alpha-ketoglutarate-dependent taurine dioxygenase
MPFHVSDLKPRIGARIETDLDTLLSGNHAGEIRELLERRGVLYFPAMPLNDEQQLAFTGTLGTLGEGGIYKVTFEEGANGPIPTDYNLGNFFWHIDRTDLDVPPRATMLSPRKLAPWGGETEFANTYAAYDDLPEEDKAMLDRLRVVHEVGASFRFVPNPTPEQLTRWAGREPKEHPLIWHHRSGRKSLVTSTSGARVAGMEKAESDALLDRLMAWASRPEYVYVHEWRMGDLVMWDNTGTMHRVRDYDKTAGRLLHRTTLLGEEPVDPAKAELVHV